MSIFKEIGKYSKQEQQQLQQITSELILIVQCNSHFPWDGEKCRQQIVDSYKVMESSCLDSESKNLCPLTTSENMYITMPDYKIWHNCVHLEIDNSMKYQNLA